MNSLLSQINLANKWQLLRIVFGTALLCLLIWYFDPQKIANSLQNLNFVWTCFTFLLIVLTSIIGAFNSYLLINLEKNLTFITFLPIFWISWATGLVLPGQVGDMASMAAQLRRKNINISVSIGRSFADKLISLILMIAFASWELTNLSSITFSSSLLAGIFAIIILCIWQAKNLFVWLNTRQNKFTKFIATAMLEAYKVIKNHPDRIVANTILTVIKICVTGISYWGIFRALGHTELEPWRFITLVAISSLVAYIPISFNGIGTAEITGVILFGTLGLNEAEILSAYLALRLIVMIIAWVPAGFLLLFMPRSQ